MSVVVASAVLSLTPPLRVGAWTRQESPQVVTPADVFGYMDGAGELYLAYRLVRIEVFEYIAPAEDPILLELYWLETSDDGYGLLSGDWGGEPLRLDDAWPAAPPRALYGAGLLRIWSGDLYVRVMATRESTASRAAVVELGRAVVAGRASPAPPELAAALPGMLASSFRLRMDQVTFLRSHLVLNSIYFLGTANLLDLGAATEAVAASYLGAEAPQGARLRLVVVRYPTETAAREAAGHFRRSYLRSLDAVPVETAVERVEDGWLGCRLGGRRLVLVFEAQDAATVKAVLEQVQP